MAERADVTFCEAIARCEEGRGMRGGEVKVVKELAELVTVELRVWWSWQSGRHQSTTMHGLAIVLGVY